MKKNVMALISSSESSVRVPETPSTRRGGCPRARETVRHAAADKEPRRHGSARTGRAPEAEMGTPVLVGARGGKGATQRLVGAAVDLGLELRRDGIQGLLEVRVVAATVRLLQPLPG